jgi:hypothetical protein
LVIEGVLRCLLRYDDDLIRVGGGIRPFEVGGPAYELDRLRCGLAALEEAGESCEGGVYGIRAVGE